MWNFICKYRANRRIKLLRNAEVAFESGHFSAVYSNLAKLAGLSTSEVRRAFRIAALLKGKSEFALLREALEPKLQS